MLRPGVAVPLLFLLSALLMMTTGMESVAYAQAQDDPAIDLVGESAQLAGYLLIFIVLAALLVHLGKRVRPSLTGSGPIQIIDGRNLAPGVGVRLIRVGSQSWLIGVTKERVSLLANIAQDDLSTEAFARSTAAVDTPHKKPAAWTGVGNHESKD